MKTLLIFFTLVTSFKLYAQQNFFNVPSSEITSKGHSFFQQQINATADLQSFNSTYDYGVKDSWEVGLNVFGLNINRSGRVLHNNQLNGDSIEPTLLVNSQHGLKINKNIHGSLGFQGGNSLEIGRAKNSPFYYYGNLEFKSDDSEYLFVIGLFQANRAYSGNGNGWLQVGLEFPIIPEKLHFVGDFINGNSTISQGVLGFSYFPVQHFALSGGYQFPSPGSSVQHGIVVELTFLPPWRSYGRKV